MVGTLLGQRYELLEQIGKGGMADVYKAKCTLLNRNVAIKILREEFNDDEDFLKRFNAESQAAAGLSHNNIVSVYDVGVQGELHYIVMEYVEGITLKEYLLKHGALSWEKAVHFACQIASGLQHAHRKGIVHRDIKPQNILVTKDETLKVTDFGIARAVSSVTMKVDDNSFGTVHYCSPEQARGGYTDAKSDIYSLGVVLYEMVTGKLPFEGDSTVSVALKHLQEEAVSPRTYAPDIPDALESIIMQAMKKEQAERFPSVSEMYIELSMLKQGKNYTVPPIAVDTAATDETRVFSQEEMMKVTEELEKVEKSKASSKKKGKKTKQDKIAAWAGIGTAFLVVVILSFLVHNFFFADKQSEENVAPDLIGMNFEEAKDKYPTLNIIKDGEDFSDKYKAGQIISQKIKAGMKIKSQYPIHVVISKGPESVIIPDVVGEKLRDAEIKLRDLGLNYKTEYEKSDLPDDEIISIEPAPGTEVRAGDKTVVLTVSTNKSNSGDERPSNRDEEEEEDENEPSENPSEDTPSSDRPSSGNQPSTNPSTGNQPSNNPPSGNTPGGSTPSGNDDTSWI